VKNGRDLPARRPKTDAEKAVQRIVRWWNKHYLGDVLGEVSLSQAMADVGVLSLAVLARILADPKSKLDDRLRIALTMAPRMIAEARGRIRGGTGGSGTAEGLGGLLEAYNVTVKATTDR
jgi:hypothetical protein